jgi:hypothetical protein
MKTADISTTQERLHVESQMMAVFISFFSIMSIVHFEIISQGPLCQAFSGPKIEY